MRFTDKFQHELKSRGLWLAYQERLAELEKSLPKNIAKKGAVAEFRAMLKSGELASMGAVPVQEETSNPYSSSRLAAGTADLPTPWVEPPEGNMAKFASPHDDPAGLFAPVKRPRGRPRKQPLLAQDASESSDWRQTIAEQPASTVGPSAAIPEASTQQERVPAVAGFSGNKGVYEDELKQMPPEWWDSGKVTMAEAAPWVAANLRNPEMRPLLCPSSTAWHCWCWARESDANEKIVWQSAMDHSKAAAKDTAEVKKRKDDNAILERLDRVLERFAKETA